MNYKELRIGLDLFRNLFIKKILPNRLISGKENRLKSIRESKEWSQSDALYVYSILRTHSIILKKYGFDINHVPKIINNVNTSSARKVIQKLVGYDNDTFIVMFPYPDDYLVKQVKVIGGWWDGKKNYWRVPLVNLDQLRDFGKRNAFNATEKARAMLNSIYNNYSLSYKAEAVDLDINFKLKPYDFQSSGIDYGMRNKRFINADEMGLGKTPQGMLVPLGLDKFPCLIICPKTLRGNWANEIEKFTYKKSMIINKKNYMNLENFYKMGMADYFIMNFESAKAYFTKDIKDILITKGPNAGTSYKKVTTHDFGKIFKSVIIDEAHECNNDKTLRFKTIKPIIKAAEIRILLTGTPIVKGTKDLASLLELIGRIDEFGGRFKFIKTYNKMNDQSLRHNNIAANLKDLNIKLRSLCFIRREKVQVMKELPEKIRQIIKVELTNRDEYDEAVNAFRFWMQNQGYSLERMQRAQSAEMLVKMNVLKQISARGKLVAFKNFVSETLVTGKLVVFCWYKDTARYIHSQFENSLMITGDQKDDEINQNVKLFQESPNHKLIILTYKKGGTGLTLTAASTWASIEPPWTYKDQAQAEDRCHRIGAKNTVNCYHFLGENTIDEPVYEVIQERGSMEKEATGGTTEIKTSITKYLTDKIMGNADEGI